MIKTYLELGQIVSTHGIRGEVKINPWCDEPDFAKHFNTVFFDCKGEAPVRVLSCRSHKNMILMQLEGYDTIEKAETLRNKMLYIRRSDIRLQEGIWFIEELIGCRVLDADDPDVCYGTLTDISKTGANDVWAVTDEKGREYLLPAIKDVVIDADVANDRIYIRPLKGIFDDAD